jgi:hypothetical protein
MIHNTAAVHRWGVCCAAAMSLFFFLVQSADAQTANSSISPPISTPGSVTAWPTAGSLVPGTNVLINTARAYGVPYRCKVESVDERGIACRGPHHRPVVYERSLVGTLSVETQHLRHAFLGFVVTGALLTGGGLVCVFAGGGAGCAVALAAGLVVDLVAGILHSVYEVREPGEPTPIYIAPSAPASGSPATA